MVSYEVQGRRARNGVRLATETSHRAALATAGEMAADGFTREEADLRELIELVLNTRSGDALTTLTAATRLSQRLADLRWPTALTALHQGATPADVADAVGDDDVEWITVAITAWADQQLHDGHLDRADHDRLTAPLTTATA